MTTYFERARSLYWGRQILDEVRHHPSLPSVLVQRARDLYQLYPPAVYIEAVAAGATARFSASEVQAIHATGVFLKELDRRESELRLFDLVARTLRHYPSPFQENAGFVYWPDDALGKAS